MQIHSLRRIVFTAKFTVSENFICNSCIALLYVRFRSHVSERLQEMRYAFAILEKKVVRIAKNYR